MRVRHLPWFAVLLLSSAAFAIAPKVTSTNPTIGPVGTQVQIIGSGFGASQGTSSVILAGRTPSVVSWSDTLITAVISPDAVTGQVYVTVGGITSNATIIFNVPGPQISSISPSTGTVGTQVTVHGSGFQATQRSGSTIHFNGLATNPTSWSDTQIVANVPANTKSGPVTVFVNGVGSNQDALFTMPNPNVTSLSPSSGPTGTQVQLIGTGFGSTQGASSVQFNSINATVSSWSDTQISATVPATAASGVVKVIVGGVSSVNNVNFTVPPAQVNTVSPSVGIGGTQITVSGSGFQATKGTSSTLSINGSAATTTSWSDTQIVATVPSSPTTGPVKVTINNVSSNLDVLFTVPSPVITQVSPVSGAYGAQVQINGTGFGTTQGSNRVTFNSMAAPIVSWSDTQIVATVPVNSGIGDVRVQVTVSSITSTSNVFFNTLGAHIDSISPTSGPPGTQVTINGSHFGATRTQGLTNGSTSYPFFNGSSGSVVSWSDTQIVATVPASATSGPLTVSGVCGTSNADSYFSMANPIVSSISPSTASVGSQVQINGSGFGVTQGTGTVAFYPSSTATVVSWSDTQIVATIPSTATSGGLTVATGGVTSNNNINFNVPPPQIISIAPTSGVVGTQITVNGSGFQSTKGSSSITLASGATLSVVSWSDNQIVATLPSGAMTGDVSVTVNGRPSNRDWLFTLPKASISAIAPTGGPVGTQVTISGSGFGAVQGSSTLTLNGVPIPIVSWSDTSITGTIPSSGTSGWAYLTVGGVLTSTPFTVANLYIGSYSPAAGPAGTPVTLTGTGFGATQGTSTVLFNNVAIPAVTWSNSQIVANVPAGAVSAPFSVKVGTTTVSTSQFVVSSLVVNSVSPTSGIPGTQVQINGGGFGSSQGTSWVGFAGQSASVVTWSDTSITAAVPNAASTGAVAVHIGAATSNSNVNFTVISPSVSGLSPSSGPSGTQVQISGSGFGATQGTSTLSFSGTQATSISTWSDGLIVATVPPGAWSGAVYTTVGGLDSNRTIYFTVPTPVITSISPTSGMVGTQVTVNGSGFLNVRGSGTIFFNGKSAAVTSWTDTQVVATVPAAAQTGPVRIVVNSSNQSNQDIVFSMPNPVITAVTPAVGYMGTQVQISGSGFGATQGSSSLTFNSVAATPTTWSDSVITTTVPASATTGVIAVSVGGVSSASTISFTVPAPQVTSISPNVGVTGTQVTVTGSGFRSSQGSGNLYYLNNSTLPIVSWSDTQIVATITSSGITGPLSVWQNIASNKDIQFTFINPVITSLSPASGLVGTQVQINGSGFGTTQGSSTVAFYNATGSIVSWSDTQIVATVPTTSRSGPVTVLVGGITSNSNINFTVPLPRVTSVTPTSGTVGTTVTINGSGFQSVQGSGAVNFNNASAAPIVSWSDTQIVAQVPAGALSGAVRVSPSNSASSNVDVVFNMPNPVITGLVPAVGPGGTQVQVNGSGFGATRGSSTITIGSVSPTVVSWSDTQIVALVPMTIGNSSAAQVTQGGVPSNANVYFTVPPPTLTSLSPTVAGGGNAITITGTGFQTSQSSNSQVIMSGGGATVKSWSDTQIVALAPATMTTGSATVWINGAPSNNATLTVPPNAISSLSPTTGPVGTQVTVNGAGFGGTQGTSVLNFNGQSAASIVSWSDSQIVATVPVTATTGPAVVAVNNFNSNATNVFTVPPPNVSSFSPHGGNAGTQITITGTAFQANQRNSTITFNGVAATPTSWTDTQIVANVPSSASSGPLHVTVNNVPDNSGITFEVPNPVITSVTPPEAPAGGIITIAGSGFGPYDPYAPTGFVNLNGASNYISVVSWSDTSITAEVMDQATSGTLTVAKFDATSNGVPFTVEGAPTIASISPAISGVGSTVTITGSGFGPSQSSSTLQFYGVLATVASWTDTQIIATVPPGTATGPVNVFVAGVKSANSQFTVNNSVQVTDSLGHVTSYVATMLGGAWHPSFMMGSGCSSCTIRGALNRELDSVGKVLSNTDELQHKTFFAYDAAGNLTSNTIFLDPNTPVTTSYTYNSFGEPLTVTDPLGNVTTNTYDAKGNLLTVTSPKPDAPTAASVTQFAYDTHGQLTQITDPLNHITTLAYYPTGLIHTITDAQSNVTSYEYDLRGNRTAVVDAQQNRTTFAYDLGNRLTGITYPDSTSVSFAYDSRGRRTSVTDQNGTITSYAYDDADRLTSATNAALNVTTYAYDTENNLLSITDANSHTTSFTYDAFGRVTQTSFPSGLNETYVYDAVSNLTSKTDRKSQTILYVYDALNRLSHKGYPDATGVDYVYDLAGKMKQVADPSGSYGFAYDNMGRLIGTTTQYSFLAGTTYSNAYGYDTASNRTSFTAPDGSTNTYAYDTLNRLTTLTNSLTGQFGFSYDALSRRTSLNRPNGVSTSYSYDSLSRLLNVLHKAGTVTLDGTGYTYDSAGSRIAKTNYLNNITENYTYDPTYQLTQVTQGTTTTESYSYDAVGNRLSSLSMSPYAYNSSNELTSTPAATFTYDSNGNTLTKADSNGTTTYNWDFENKLISVILPGTGGTVTFKYDPSGRRIHKSSPNGMTNYLYDGSNSVAETDAAGTLLASYAQGAGVDEPLAELRNGTVGYYEQDGLGSVTSVAGATGALLNSATYDSFGNHTSSTGSFANPFQYTGRDSDPETGLLYYRARYYDATTGRFLSEDPIAGLGSRYRYVANNPIKLVDRFGLSYEVAQSGNTITVSADVIIFGPGATSALAAYWQAYANTVWNGTGQTYMGCKVIFKIQMRADPTHTLPPVRDGVGGSNAIYIPDSESGYFRSFVSEVGGWSGAWWAGASGETASHEVGHLFRLPDYYRDYWHGIRVPLGWGDSSTPMAGHENDLMGDSQNGWPQQAEIDQILKGKAKACQCR